jgi:hypothetical protein
MVVTTSKHGLEHEGVTHIILRYSGSSPSSFSLPEGGGGGGGGADDRNMARSEPSSRWLCSSSSSAPPRPAAFLRYSRSYRDARESSSLLFALLAASRLPLLGDSAFLPAANYTCLLTSSSPSAILRLCSNTASPPTTPCASKTRASLATSQSTRSPCRYIPHHPTRGSGEGSGDRFPYLYSAAMLSRCSMKLRASFLPLALYFFCRCDIFAFTSRVGCSDGGDCERCRAMLRAEGFSGSDSMATVLTSII